MLCSRLRNLLHTVVQTEYTDVQQTAYISAVSSCTNGALLDTPGLHTLAAVHLDNEAALHA